MVFIIVHQNLQLFHSSGCTKHGGMASSVPKPVGASIDISLVMVGNLVEPLMVDNPLKLVEFVHVIFLIDEVILRRLLL